MSKIKCLLHDAMDTIDEHHGVSDNTLAWMLSEKCQIDFKTALKAIEGAKYEMDEERNHAE